MGRFIAPVALVLAGSACAGSNANATADVALVTSVIAVAIGGVQTVFVWRQARIQDDQRYAAVWPRLVFETSMYSSDVDGGSSEHRVLFGVTNKGVGPAIVRAFRLKLDGVAVSSVKDLIVKVYGRGVPYSASNIVGEVLSPGEKVAMVEVEGDAERVRLLRDTFLTTRDGGASSHVEASVCYCSVFEQCWWVERHGGEPVATSSCPHDPSTTNFNDAW
jgi:hypothetical protein